MSQQPKTERELFETKVHTDYYIRGIERNPNPPRGTGALDFIPKNLRTKANLCERDGESYKDEAIGAMWHGWQLAQAARRIPSGAELPVLTGAARDVLAERERQQSVEGWTPEHDDEHDQGDLASAGAAYAMASADKLHPASQGDGGFDTQPPPCWPWSVGWWKPGDPRRNLVKAGALILAEVERIDRFAASSRSSGNVETPK